MSASMRSMRMMTLLACAIAGAASGGTSPVELACRAILVDVVRHGPDQALKGRKLHELVTPFRRAFTVLVQRCFDQEPVGS
uniref:Secreted protein n=1 Tax=Arthrobacter sp. AK-1 TaxID=415095 RepID=A6YFL1_9MICC|nr:unknown [Arthrobacter sp. AK-1]